MARSSDPWEVFVPYRVLCQIRNIPDERIRDDVAEWMRKFRRVQTPEYISAEIDDVQDGHRLRIENWRVLYVVDRRHREVYVGDVVIRDEYTYSKVRLQHLADQRRRNPVYE